MIGTSSLHVSRLGNVFPSAPTLPCNKGGSPSQCRLVSACSPAYIVMSHYNGHTVLGTVQSLLCAWVDLSLIIIMGLRGLLVISRREVSVCRNNEHLLSAVKRKTVTPREPLHRYYRSGPICDLCLTGG